MVSPQCSRKRRQRDTGCRAFTGGDFADDERAILMSSACLVRASRRGFRRPVAVILRSPNRIDETRPPMATRRPDMLFSGRMVSPASELHRLPDKYAAVMLAPVWLFRHRRARPWHRSKVPWRRRHLFRAVVGVCGCTERPSTDVKAWPPAEPVSASVRSLSISACSTRAPACAPNGFLLQHGAPARHGLFAGIAAPPERPNTVRGCTNRRCRPPRPTATKSTSASISAPTRTGPDHEPDRVPGRLAPDR